MAATPANTFAQFRGRLDTPASVAAIPLRLDAGDFVLAGGGVQLGFLLSRGGGSDLDPALPRVLDAGGNPISPGYAQVDLAGKTQSLAIASLGEGDFTLQVSGERGTSGDYLVDVYLVGDADGSHGVDNPDGLLIRGLLGSTSADTSYRPEADADLDGQISSRDYSLWRQGRGDSTAVRRLSLDLDVSPAPEPQPDGSLLSTVAQVRLEGKSLPGAAVTLDVDGDGFDDGSILADGGGNYGFDVTLVSGSNALTVRAADRFGQEAVIPIVLSFAEPDDTPPQVTAALVNDTSTFGGTDSDGRTGDPSVAGKVVDAGGIAALRAGFGGATEESYLDITDAVEADGSFALDRSRLETILGGAMTDGAYSLHLIAADTIGNVSPARTVEFVLDTAAPALGVVDPASGGVYSATARLVGAVGEGTVATRYRIDEGEFLPVAVDLGGSFDLAAAAEGLSEGAHRLTIESSDVAGNVTGRTVDFAVGGDFLVGPSTSEGWGSRLDAVLTLRERDSFLVQQSVDVDLGLAEGTGTRTITFDVLAALDVASAGTLAGDRLLVYLVDPADPTSTLLDRGVAGTAAFALSETGAEFAAGLVRFDGRTVTIDASGVVGPTSGRLVFQLVGGDADTGSVVRIAGISSVADPQGLPATVVETSPDGAAPGDALDLARLSPSSTLKGELGDVRFDSSRGIYRASLRMTNPGDAVGRDVAVVFPGLPAGVTLENASGTDAAGAPYVNFRGANPAGGLGSGMASRPITLIFTDPDMARIVLAPTILVGPPNRAPVFGPVGPLTVRPGARLEVPLAATDPDGDRVTFALRSEAPLPTGSLLADGRLVFTPRSDQLGSYTFALAASDGVLETVHQVSLTVEPDPVVSTRFTGRILNTDGEPIVGIPIELGRIIAITDADGSFTIELPSSLLPTEEFSIRIPLGDPQFDPFDTGTQVITLRRARFDTTTGTDASNPRLHPNLVSAFIDAGIVYGSDTQRALALRSLQGGRLKTSPGDLPPLNNTDYFPGGPLENDNQGILDPSSFLVAGDVRANENVALASLHTLLMREHNRKADEIARANPGLDDEEIYQRARKYVSALIEKITYYEYLPLLLGPEAIPTYTGYDPTVDPQTGTLFASAAFRFGHSQMVPQLLLLDPDGLELPGGPISLREAFFTTEPIQEFGIDPILRGLVAQQAQQIDTRIIDELRNFLFGPPGSGGQDLPAMTIQRGRDMGLPSYTQARLDLGLSPVTDFDQITSDVEVRDQLSSTYGTVDKIDVFVGGLAEDHAPGAMVGELFQTIIRDQFLRLRAGDRFWFENGQFSQADLDEIRNTSLADVIERNTGITGLSGNVFTTQEPSASPEPGGMAADDDPTEYRSIDGSGNNAGDPTRGQAGRNLRIDSSLRYADGISEPNGADRPGPRTVTNGTLAQSGSIPNTSGATALMVFWGQILSHDTDQTPVGTSNTLKIHGEAYVGDVRYPFVAEKLPLVMDHPFDQNVNNIIARPIYLPVLDVANGTVIDPTVDLMVTTPTIPGGAVEVAAGTLLTRQGELFTGVLSMSQVPSSLTPASLPEGVFPDFVVTIQPAEMVFTTPAPLTLPNRGGYAPGTVMDLWSINPITGQFDKVGVGKVSDDGSVIETVSGGIRNSSWQFFSPPPPTPVDPMENDRNRHEDCAVCRAAAGLTSEVELHSGQVLETHRLAPYQSQGVVRQLALRYDSLRADPRQIVHLGYDDTAATDDSWRMVGRLTVRRGTFQMQVPGFQPRSPQPTDFQDTSFGTTNDLSETTWTVSGTAGQRLFFDVNDDAADAVVALYDSGNNPIVQGAVSILGSPSSPGTVVLPYTGSYTLKIRGTRFGFDSSFTLRDVSNMGLSGGENFFRVGSDSDAALIVDLRDQPTGVYEYSLTTALRRFNGQAWVGSGSTSPGMLLNVNGIGSPFGNGWNLAGLQQIVVAGNGAVVLIDGDGSDMIFGRPPTAGETYVSPQGDFSTLVRLEDGTFRRTLADQTVYQFDASDRLSTMVDRNGNITRFQYDADGNLDRIVDPVGLETRFDYLNGHLATVTDPAGRVTRMDYDVAGNLVKITDPDGSSRDWIYDELFHMSGEVDQRGSFEQTFYDWAGRATGAVRKDGTQLQVRPTQVEGLFRPELTDDPFTAPMAPGLGPAASTYVDGNGNVITTRLSQTGQPLGSSDGVGPRPSFDYDANFLPIRTVDGRGHITLISFDERGNVIGVKDELSIGKGGSVFGAIASAGEVDEFTFEAFAGQVLYYDALDLDPDFGSLWITLLGPDGQAQPNFYTYSADYDSEPFTLSETGTYRLVIQGNGAATDDYAFRILDLSAAPAVEVSPGAIVEGKLDTPASTTILKFEGVAGQRVILDGLSDPTIAVSIYRPDYGFLSTDSGSGVLVTTLPLDGNYYLLIFGASIGGAPVDFRFDSRDESIAPVLELGVPAQATLSPPSRAAFFRYSALAGEILLLETSGGGQFSWRYVGPGDSFETYLNPGQLIQFAAQGEYLFYASSSFNNGTDPIDVGIELTLPVGSVELTPGQVVEGRLDDANPVATYRFSVAGGTRIALSAPSVSQAFVGYFELYQPGVADSIASNNLEGGTFVDAPVDGEYLLIVTAFLPGDGSALDYQLRFDLPGTTTTPIAPGDLIVGSIATPGQIMEYTFEGTIGQALMYDGLVDTVPPDPFGDAGTYVSLYDPDGQWSFLSALDEGFFDTLTADGTSRPFILAKTGTYRLVIQSQTLSTGDFQFRLLDLASVPSVALGDEASGTLDPANEVAVFRIEAPNGAKRLIDMLSSSRPGIARWTLFEDGGGYAPGFGASLADDLPFTSFNSGKFLLVLSTREGGDPIDYRFRYIDPASQGAVVTPGEMVSGRLDPANQAAIYRFIAPSGQVVVIDGLSASRPGGSWLLTNGYDSRSGAIGSDLVLVPSFGFPQDLEYSLYVAASDGGEPIDFQFRLLDTSAIPQVGLGPVVGHVDAANPMQVFRVSNDINLPLILQNLTITRPGAARWALYTDFSSGPPQAEGPLEGSLAIDPFVYDDKWLLVVTLDTSSGTDPVDFTFRQVDPTASPEVARDADIVGRLDPATQTFVYRFRGQTGDRLVLDSRAVTRPGAATWTLYGPSADTMGTVPLEADQVATLYADGDLFLVISGTGTAGLDPVDFTFRIVAAEHSTTRIAVSGPGGGGLSLTYDPVFNLVVSMTDELGHLTLYGRDPANGNLLSITRVVGEPGGDDDIVTLYTYTTQGQVDTQTDPLGRVTDYDYDSLGRLVTVTYAKGTPDQGVSHYEYDAAGNVIAAIDENGHRTEYDYDAMNRLMAVRDALGNPTTFDHDAGGNVVATTDALGHTTAYAYDPLGRLISTTDAVGQATLYAYDRSGNLTSTTDPLGHVTRYRYDARDRRIEAIDPEGGVSRYEYDVDDNLVALIDPAGNKTLFAYDARGRLVSETDPLGKKIRYEYDAANNLTAKVDRDGRRIEYVYDDLDRMTTETWIGEGNVVHYAYDKVGNLLSAVDDQSALAFTYDARNRVVTADNAGTPNAPHVVLSYSHDAVGNVLSVSDTVDGAAGATTTHSYDAVDRTTRITQVGAGLADKRVDFSYNAIGQFATIDRYSDLAGTQLVAGSTYAYDALDRLTGLTHANAGGTLAFYRLAFDDAGRITHYEDVDGATDYTYDRTNQLTGADHNGGANPDETYAYDANGNRTSSSLHGSAYQTGAGNRLLSDGTYSYEYDAEGNMTLRTEIATGLSREFSWDHRNRLIAVVDRNTAGVPTQRVEYTYDALNRRIAKAVDTTPGDLVDAALTHFVYDRQDVIMDFADPDGASGPDSPSLSQRYLHGPAIDQVLSQDDGKGGIQWLLSDHQGTIRDLGDNTGALANHVVYDSYGRLVSETNPLIQSRYRFTGREFDAESGLYYYRARYYDGSIGRFLSEDPARYRTGETNYWRYVGNSPVSGRDPMGLDSQSVTVPIGSIDVSTAPIEKAVGTAIDKSSEVGKKCIYATKKKAVELKNKAKDAVDKYKDVLQDPSKWNPTIDDLTKTKPGVDVSYPTPTKNPSTGEWSVKIGVTYGF